MNSHNPDRISIEETAELEVYPKWVVLEIVIEGESSFFGDEAFRKSKEVAQFLSELDEAGYSQEHVTLENVAIQTSSGKILKSSMARYSLRLDRIEPAKVPGILTIIAGQKNIDIEEMSYYFGELKQEKSEMFLNACLAAKEQGLRISGAFGVPLLGVYCTTASWRYPAITGISQREAARGLMMSKARGTERRQIAGLDFVANYRSKLELLLKVDFRVGGFSQIKP